MISMLTLQPRRRSRSRTLRPSLPLSAGVPVPRIAPSRLQPQLKLKLRSWWPRMTLGLLLRPSLLPLRPRLRLRRSRRTTPRPPNLLSSAFPARPSASLLPACSRPLLPRSLPPPTASVRPPRPPASAPARPSLSPRRSQSPSLRPRRG